MAYTPREIKDRVAVGDDIFQVEDLGNNQIRLIPAPTYVSEPGTPVNKALLQHMENHLVPPGAIIMWSGAINDIPVGWALCDGSNGTPDLRDRFIVGAGLSYYVGNTGGSNTVALSINHLPPHTHGAGTLDTNVTGLHAHTYQQLIGQVQVQDVGTASVSSIEVIGEYTSSEGNHKHTISGSTASAGGGLAHENRPPYYALCFIMKL